VLNLPITAG